MIDCTMPGLKSCFSGWSEYSGKDKLCDFVEEYWHYDKITKYSETKFVERYQKWATDVTEFKIPGDKKKLYLSAILDLYDRSVVAYVVGSRNDNKLVFDTFDAAILKNPDAKPIFHSDRGFQYTNKVFQQKLKTQGMVQSMSRVGQCIDNGTTEGLWGIIKTEMYCLHEINDEMSLRTAIDKNMDFYNNERPQGRYDCKTPTEVRSEALAAEIPALYPIPENKRIQKYKEKWMA